MVGGIDERKVFLGLGRKGVLGEEGAVCLPNRPCVLRVPRMYPHDAGSLDLTPISHFLLFVFSTSGL